MIVLEDLTVLTSPGGGLASVNAVLPSDRRIALMGPSDNDKVTLIKILAGLMLPNGGRVVRHASLSFPVGQLPGFSRELSVRVNVAHAARLYGADVRQTLQVIEEAFGKSPFLDEPYEDLPRDMRKPLSQITALALPFDTYLFADQRDFPAVRKRAGRGGQTRFSAACEYLVERRIGVCGMIIPTNDLVFAQRYCEMAIFLDRSRLELLNSFAEAEALLRRNRRRRLSGG